MSSHCDIAGRLLSVGYTMKHMSSRHRLLLLQTGMAGGRMRHCLTGCCW